MTGYSEQTIINWEKGVYRPGARAIGALEKAFNTTLSEEENDEKRDTRDQ